MNPESKMEIRKALAADAEAVIACARAAYAPYVERIGREPAPMIADFAAQIDRGIVFVAIDETKAVAGFVVFFPRGDGMHLENVALSPACQGRGLGKSLIGFVEDRARAAGLSSVELYTNEKMTENQVLYPRLGYREIERRTEDGFARIYYRKTV